MYFNENANKKFMCNIDLLITVELRFFESQQYAVSLLRKWHSCLRLSILFSFELEAF